MDVLHRPMTKPQNMSRAAHSHGNSRGVDMSAIPWLLPVLVAVSMVVFLVISFSLHHRRFLQQRRRTCPYYLLTYHRVSGPLFSMADRRFLTAPQRDSFAEDETNLPKARKIVQKLRRFNTWSPQIFKTKYARKFSRKYQTANSPSKDSGTLHNVASTNSCLNESRASCHNDSRASSVSEFGSLRSPSEQSDLLSVTDLSRMARSNSCRARLVVVTTSTGALAVARRKAGAAAGTPDHVVLPGVTRTSREISTRDSQPFLENLEEQVSQGMSCDSESDGIKSTHKTSDMDEERTSHDMHMHSLDDTEVEKVAQASEKKDLAGSDEAMANSETFVDAKRGNTMSEPRNPPSQQNCLSSLPTNNILVENASRNFDGMASALNARVHPTHFHFKHTSRAGRANNADPETGSENLQGSSCLPCPSTDVFHSLSSRLETYPKPVSIFMNSLKHTNSILRRLRDLYHVSSERETQVRSSPELKSDMSASLQCKQCQTAQEALHSLADCDVENIQVLIDILGQNSEDNQRAELQTSPEVDKPNRDVVFRINESTSSEESLKCKWLDSNDHCYLDTSLTSLHDVVSSPSN